MAEEKTVNEETSTEEEEHECPECPPKGAPAWMATFADMATLLKMRCYRYTLRVLTRMFKYNIIQYYCT